MARQLGDVLREWRTARGLTLGALAMKAGVHASTLSRWETGRWQPGVPELEAVLKALGATAAQRRSALHHLEAPRAVQRVRAEAGESPPAAGDLLRAMRLRRNMTQADVAERIGATQSVLAKWERSEDWPSAERLHALCFALGAHADEVTALTTRRFWLPEEADESDSPDGWENRVQTAYRWSGPLRDLRFLSFEASLWRRAEHDLRVQTALRYTYAYHLRGLVETDRLAEAKGILNRLQKEAVPGEDRETYPQTVLFAAQMAGRRDPAGAARMLTEAVTHVRDPEYRSWMLGDLGIFLAEAGYAGQAERVSEAACRIAERSPEASTSAFRRRDQARTLMVGRRYEAALTALEAATPLRIWDDADAIHLLMETECLLGLGKRAEAQDRLVVAAEAEAVVNTPHLRAQADRLTQHLSRRRSE